MIPFTFPSQPSVVSGNAECKVWYLSSVVGMARWIDYIPVRQTATASPIEGRTDAGGYQAVTLLSSISGLAAWTDYIPVYEDSSATVAWGTGADGYIPVGSAGAALSLQMLGTNTLDPRITFTRASSGTHFDSTGRLVTDGNNVARFDYDPAVAAGVTGGELAPTISSANYGVSANVSVDTGSIVFTAAANANYASVTSVAINARKKYTLVVNVSSISSGSIAATLGNNTSVGALSVGLNTISVYPTIEGSWFGIRATTANTTAVVTSVSVQEVTFTPRGLLIEEQRTNLLLHSRDMTQAAWSKTDVTAARTQVGIDGVASSACLMTEGSAGTASLREDPSVTAGSTITGSVILKRGSTDWVRIILADTTLTDGANAWFNLNTGAKGVLSVRGAATNLASTITSLGGGWYRCTVTCTPNGAYTIATVFLNTASADNSTTRVANATYIVDCAQLEVGAFATSPIITGAATATRAADSASMTGTNLTSWMNTTSGTLYVETAGVLNPAGPIASFDVSTTNTLGLFWTSGNTVIAEVTAGTNISQGFLTAASVNKMIYAYAPSDRALSVNGAAVSASATGSFPASVDTFRIGVNRTSTQRINGHIRSIRYYNTRLPNATLTALTA